MLFNKNKDVYKECKLDLQKETVDKIEIRSVDVKTGFLNYIIEKAQPLTRKEAYELFMKNESSHNIARKTLNVITEENICFTKDNKAFFIVPTDKEMAQKLQSGYACHLLSRIYFKVSIDNSIKDIVPYDYINSKVTYRNFELDKETTKDKINMRRFVRFNKFDTLGKTTWNPETTEYENIEYKDKDGNPIKLKSGFVYKCQCDAYEEAEKLSLFVSAEMQHDPHPEAIKVDCFINKMIMLDVTCSACGETMGMDNVSYVGSHSSINGVIYQDIFNDIEEKGKITLASLTETTSFFGDSYKRKRMSDKIVFNVETGRTYMLPQYNTMTKKKTGSLVQLGTNRIRREYIRVTIPEVIQIGKAIEKYVKTKENGKYVIAFNTYLKKALHRELGRVFYSADKEEKLEEYSNEIDKLYNNEYVSDETITELSNSLYNFTGVGGIELLTCYNQNPYYSYDVYKDLCKITSKQDWVNFNGGYPSKVKTLKRVRQIHAIKTLNQILQIKGKIERKFIAKSKDRVRDYSFLYNVKKTVKNQDNINKLLLATPSIRLNAQRLNTNYYNALVESFGETNVINALVSNQVREFGHSNARYYEDTIYNYDSIIKVIPDYKLPCDRLRLKELHDKISKDATKIKYKERLYTYEEELLNKYDNISIDELTFTVAKSNLELIDIGSQMGICVGGYWHSVEAGDLFIVHMTNKEGDYVGCLEISKGGALCQAKARYNARLTPDALAALKEYCLQTELAVLTIDVPKEYAVNTDKKVSYNRKPINVKVTIDGELHNIAKPENMWNENRLMPMFPIIEEADAIPF